MKKSKLAHSLFWIGVILIQAAGTSFADELDNIQRARETAEMKYVNEIGSGKYKTRAQQEALRKELLEPQEQKTRDYFKSISAMPTPRAVSAAEVDLKSGPKTMVHGTEGGTTLVTGQSVSPSHANPSADRGSLRPEFVLDGSNVPKEVTFGTPSK